MYMHMPKQFAMKKPTMRLDIGFMLIIKSTGGLKDVAVSVESVYNE